MRHIFVALSALAALAGCAAPTDSAKPDGPRMVNGIGYNPIGPNHYAYGWNGTMFPVANRNNWWQQGYTVDSFTRMHELYAARKVAAAAPSPLARAGSEPAIAYEGSAVFGNGRFTQEEFLKRNPTTGLLVARGDGEGGGTILIERYQYGRTDKQRFTSFSMAKTVTAMLFGIAMSEGFIRSLDDKAEDYVAGLKGSEYGRTPLRNLLTMSSGVAFREDYNGIDDAAKLTASVHRGPGGVAAVTQFNTRTAEPGKKFYYASAETQVLGLVLTAAIKRPLADYLSEKVWQPMGAEADAFWNIDPTGQEATYAYFNATLRDYARFGLLLANGGRKGSQQIIPADWLKQATTPAFSRPNSGPYFGYGFQTWIFPEADGNFAMLGVRGQAIYIDPGRKLVMVHTAVRPAGRDPGGADATAFWRGVKASLN